MSYKVKLNIFEGPLDLLLFLIKREKIDIYDIPISLITSQYMEYLKLMEMLDLDIAGEFLVMAATLMHIKSKMLLPPEETDEEEEDELDPREELVKRLLEYKKFKDAADNLSEMKNRAKDMYLRQGTGGREKIVSEDGTEYYEASLFDLIKSFQKVLTTVSKEAFHKVVKDRYSVGDKISEITYLISRKSKIYFTSLFSKMREKDEIVATFMAVLELMKRREVLAVQQENYGEIEIIKNPDFEQEQLVEEVEQITASDAEENESEEDREENSTKETE